MRSGRPPSAPVRRLPDAHWEHYQLYWKVREAVAALPLYFRSETHIAGVMATDLHTLNAVLGATIEDQAVRTLNLIRNTWDPQGRYALFSFVRHPQTFPDVRLQSPDGEETLLGIELKGWYLLAKEAEPNFRFQVTPAACAPQDLVVVVPWALGSVISGSPVLFEPFIESARFAADYRNYYWQHVRETGYDRSIKAPSSAHPYPLRKSKISDKPAYDEGGNFGRLARTGIMDDYVAKLNDVPLCGIKTAFWRDFLTAFRESSTDAEARDALERLRKRVAEASDYPSAKSQAALAILCELERLLEL